MIASLSAVIPVYNEPEWIRVAVRDLRIALSRAPFRDPEIVLVDDGSDAPTQRTLAELEAPEAEIPVRVIRHDCNAGRLAARRTGLSAARGDLAVLTDSRVSIRPDALEFVAGQLRDGELPIWNGHIDIELERNPYARFWNVLTERAFWAYFGNPHTTSFGLEDFDHFPKGTTLFLGPRERILAAIDAFRSHYDDLRDANDDTNFIRALAAEQRINIGPDFSALYRSRSSPRGFVKHAHHRGVVFVDGFLHRGTRFLPMLLAFFPASAAAAVLAVRRPALGIAGLASVPAAAAAVSAWWRRAPADVAAMAALSLPWAIAFCLGLWRGALKALLAASRR